MQLWSSSVLRLNATAMSATLMLQCHSNRFCFSQQGDQVACQLTGTCLLPVSQWLHHADNEARHAQSSLIANEIPEGAARDVLTFCHQDWKHSWWMLTIFKCLLINFNRISYSHSHKQTTQLNLVETEWDVVIFEVYWFIHLIRNRHHVIFFINWFFYLSACLLNCLFVCLIRFRNQLYIIWHVKLLYYYIWFRPIRVCMKKGNTGAMMILYIK